MRFFTYLLLFIGVYGLFTASAGAAQPLPFGSKIGETSRHALDGYIRTTLNQPPEQFDIAPVDLNNDGLNEFILRDKTCVSCRFFVVSEVNESIAPLGDMEGLRVTISPDSVQGVRNLLVYTNGVNDYEYSVYVWEPQSSRYMMAKDK